jgi:signal transduction histidine kinase
MLQRFEGHLGRVQHSASRVFALIELALDLAVERDLDTFQRMFCDAGRRIVDAGAAVLLLFDGSHPSATRVVASGLAGEAVAALEAAPIREALIGRAVRAGKALRQGDGNAAIGELPAGLSFNGAPMRSWLSVPLDSPIDRFGLLLFLDHRQGRRFDDEAEMLALALAAEFGVLYELFDANKALQHRAIELQLEVSQRQETEKALEQHREELASFSRRLLQQEKETTRRLAQALHDELGQTLAAMRLIYDAHAGSGNAATPNGLMRQLDQLIADANRQVRQVLIDLRPPLLDEQGLAAALDNELSQRRRLADGVTLQLLAGAAPSGPRWPSEVEYAAFMIAREAVQNALRHARAGAVRVELTAAGEELSLSVGDDGCGLPHEAVPVAAAGHLGMVGMRERAAAINGTLDVYSSPGQGTLIQLRWRPSA